MEGKYTKIGTITGVIALLITIWQLLPSHTASFDGVWKMTAVVKEAKLSTYVGMSIEWKLHLIQDGNNIFGTGEKITVNGKRLNFAGRNNLELEGTIDGDQFNITYKEMGKLRETIGTFKGSIKNNNFKGVHSQTSSDTKGEIFGNKIF